ncbi:MAG: glycosyltransferase family 4 protein [bacterium]|nr:glycosyltransferase family 4 protein [bacterium]MDT8367430.1 glycosyltransferase family 4 protein [bacterium]
MSTPGAAGYIHLIIYDDPSPEGGGIQNTAYWIGRKLEDKNLSVVVAGLEKYLNSPAYEGTTIKFFKLKRPFRTKNTTDLRLLWLLIRLRLRYGKRVVLYSLVINNVKVYRWLKYFLGWKCVSFLHGNETLRLLAQRPDTLRKNILACTCVIANTRYTKTLVERLGEFPNLWILPPGIPVENFQGPDQTFHREKLGWQDRKVILMLSRLVKRKGHLTVIKAVSKIRSKHPEVLLAIAGSGGYRADIEQLISEYGLNESVSLLGFVPEKDKPELYAACDVYCMPSEIDERAFDVEGFGITFIEAGAMGTIVIGSDTGGIPDAIEQGKTGFLIQPGDDEQLAAILDEIFSNPAEFDGMRQYARMRAVNRFSWDSHATRMLELIEGSMNGS